MFGYKALGNGSEEDITSLQTMMTIRNTDSALSNTRLAVRRGSGELCMHSQGHKWTFRAASSQATLNAGPISEDGNRFRAFSTLF